MSLSFLSVNILPMAYEVNGERFRRYGIEVIRKPSQPSQDALRHSFIKVAQVVNCFAAEFHLVRYLPLQPQLFSNLSNRYALCFRG